MKTTHIILAVAAFGTMSPLAAQNATQPGGNTAFLTQFEKTFEAGGAVPAKDFVPADLMSGRLHTVADIAANDGLRNTYFVSTDHGQYEVTGTPALIEFIREIYALDYLRGVSKTEEFGKAFANAGKAKVQSVVGLVKDPIGTIKNVPKGASRFFGRIGEGLRGTVEGGNSNGETGAVGSILGVGKAKTVIAAKLGVSPYTTNEALQQELNDVARATAGGGLVITGATAAVGGGVGTALSVVGVNQTLQATLVTSTPEDLRLINRKKLLALGADRELTEEFLMHPWFSPWHETITTDALARIGVNPAAFLREACRALTAEDAFFFQRVAQILAQYATVAPLHSIRSERGIVCGLTRDGTLVVPVSLDYAIWAERTARRTEEFAAVAHGGDDIKALAFWTDGRISERLAAEFKQRGITFRERAIDLPQ